MEILKSKIRFDASGFYLIGVLILVFLGFWPSYFSRFFNGTLDYPVFFHIHAFIAFLWIIILIIQPILIRSKKFEIHKRIGRFSYFLFPMIIISVVLLVHSRTSSYKDNLAMEVFIPFKDLFTLSVAYGIAIFNRHKIEIHARGMIATGIVFIEPALARLSFHIFGDGSFHFEGYLFTVCFIYLVLIILIISERKRKTGRWVFPLILILLIMVHSIRIFNIKIGFWEQFAEWFASLPLT